jgi:hypothetical protein
MGKLNVVPGLNFEWLVVSCKLFGGSTKGALLEVGVCTAVCTVVCTNADVTVSAVTFRGCQNPLGWITSG